MMTASRRQVDCGILWSEESKVLGGEVDGSMNVVHECHVMEEEDSWSGLKHVREGAMKFNQGDWKKAKKRCEA